MLLFCLLTEGNLNTWIREVRLVQVSRALVRLFRKAGHHNYVFLSPRLKSAGMVWVRPKETYSIDE